MKTKILVPVLGSLLLSPLAALADESATPPRRDFCYAPGTPAEVVERNAALTRFGDLAHSLTPRTESRARLDDWWTRTATDGSVSGLGTPITLTWSVVPDGTLTPDLNGQLTGTSNLRAALLNRVYGSEAGWRPIIQQMFDRWSELTGVTYVYEPADDGASLPSAPGQLGVRGDLRLSGRRLDGNFGVLAFNYFPNSGDMVIDSSDSFYDNTANNSLRLRNTLAHEHGHGLGMSHVCPINQTKLMEPYLTTSFDGPQHDDVLAGQRGYGDSMESNDSTTSPEHLGHVARSLERVDLSIDDDSDIDYFSLTVDANQGLSVTVTPVGFQYLEGPQNSNGSCSSGTTFNSATTHDLSVRVLGVDGMTELASADLNGAGLAETLQEVALSNGAGTYYVEVAGDATDGVQLYEIELATTTSVLPPEISANDFESGGFGTWTVSN